MTNDDAVPMRSSKKFVRPGRVWTMPFTRLKHMAEGMRDRAGRAFFSHAG